MKESVPKDRYNVIFVIFLIHGIGALLPWNMFITANDYFVDYKLNVTTHSTESSAYREYFLSYIGLASKVPNALFQGLNLISSQSGYHKYGKWSIPKLYLRCGCKFTDEIYECGHNWF
ncbi:equilibrative nucleoside transporter 3-like isoform X2 [Dinothrombium tinctorium]|uniref:Equilibrative nucleoside transporter 3-like isoform X2 n=1 Tax=Dinothrombium tinctorium TaxID=1965070 RepID=A0A3S3QAD4_9ACAR|nr:equilibrative nucleoside transporter 3-like isoform X2 [Dinothrombium tinctorium]